MSHTREPWYVAEKAMWQGNVRFIRTSDDKSGVVGLTNDRDGDLVAAAPDLLAAAEKVIACGALPRERHLCEAIKELEAAIKKAKGE